MVTGMKIYEAVYKLNILHTDPYSKRKNYKQKTTAHYEAHQKFQHDINKENQKVPSQKVQILKLKLHLAFIWAPL